MKKILFVCTGNICRSPTAQAVFEKMSLNIPELADWIAESAGTHG
ncbi:MAG: low molecular weight phosphotyrosine protein phosphatase, partial [Chitinophagaceae bacterium]|nr:low molecular weight phosphotyrosine protein phosphatase [Chitinophagaceae bacterium]